MPHLMLVLLISALLCPFSAVLLLIACSKKINKPDPPTTSQTVCLKILPPKATVLQEGGGAPIISTPAPKRREAISGVTVPALPSSDSEKTEFNTKEASPLKVEGSTRISIHGASVSVSEQAPEQATHVTPDFTAPTTIDGKDKTATSRMSLYKTADENKTAVDADKTFAAGGNLLTATQLTEKRSKSSSSPRDAPKKNKKRNATKQTQGTTLEEKEKEKEKPMIFHLHGLASICLFPDGKQRFVTCFPNPTHNAQYKAKAL